MRFINTAKPSNSLTTCRIYVWFDTNLYSYSVSIEGQALQRYRVNPHACTRGMFRHLFSGSIQKLPKGNIQPP